MTPVTVLLEPKDLDTIDGIAGRVSGGQRTQGGKGKRFKCSRADVIRALINVGHAAAEAHLRALAKMSRAGEED